MSRYHISILLVNLILLNGSFSNALESPQISTFEALPTELKVLILEKLKSSDSIPDAIENIKKLRILNRNFRDLIDDPSIGKIIMKVIADHIPTDAEGIRAAFKLQPGGFYNRNKFLVIAALKFGTPGAIEWLKELIQKDPNAREAAESRLIYASQENFFDTVDMLIKAGVNVNVNVAGTTPLMSATKMQSKPNAAPKTNIVRRLLESGADVNAKDNWGKTALDYVEGRKMEPIRVLLENALKRP